MDSPVFASVFFWLAISEHARLTKQSAVTPTCAVGAAGDGLFNRLVNSGEVGVGTTGFTSGGTSLVSSPVTCKNYVHNTGSLFYFTNYLSLSATTLPCMWMAGWATLTFNILSFLVGYRHLKLQVMKVPCWECCSHLNVL